MPASNILREGNWNKELEGGLPDSRLRDPSKTIIIRGQMAYEKVYCANCGKPDGLITAEWSPHVFCICNACDAKLGRFGLIEIDESVIRGKKNLIP
jgi:hypothetical protein